MEWWNSGMEGLLSAHEPLEAAPQRFPLHLPIEHTTILYIVDLE